MWGLWHIGRNWRDKLRCTWTQWHDDKREMTWGLWHTGRNWRDELRHNETQGHGRLGRDDVRTVTHWQELTRWTQAQWNSMTWETRPRWREVARWCGYETETFEQSRGCYIAPRVSGALRPVKTDFSPLSWRKDRSQEFDVLFSPHQPCSLDVL